MEGSFYLMPRYLQLEQTDHLGPIKYMLTFVLVLFYWESFESTKNCAVLVQECSLNSQAYLAQVLLRNRWYFLVQVRLKILFLCDSWGDFHLWANVENALIRGVKKWTKIALNDHFLFPVSPCFRGEDWQYFFFPTDVLLGNYFRMSKT